MAPGRMFIVAAFGAGGVLAGLHAGASQAPPGHHDAAEAAASLSASSSVPAPPPGSSLVAQVRAVWLRVYHRPGDHAPVLRLSRSTASGSSRVLLVQRLGARWVRVWLPMRPNGSRGWVRTSDVALARDDWRVVVHLRDHRLVVLRDGREAWGSRIADGAAGTPTPRGRFFVTELLRQPEPAGDYGPWAFALSGFSRVLTRFHGGRGEVGIHGTDQPWLLGRNISHGCIRLANADIVRLARVLPLGTPVDVSAS